MAEMRAERKSVFDYLSKNKFLIPIYQRNYVWSEDECEQLWDDVCNFFDNKDEDEEYFLGSVVIYKENGRQNIIDGQQRTTTLNLLIRALYEKARGQNGIDKLKSNLASCLWDMSPLTGEIDFENTHFKSEVATDSDNLKLENLFKDTLDIDKESKNLSLYEKNFIFFQNKIDELAKNKPSEWFDFCLCLLNLCVILPIECDGRDKALRIFNTLNNRGVSLSPADIFKGLIFERKREESEKNKFAKEWKELESKIQNSNYLNKEDISFLFAQYEHIIRAEHKEVDTVIPGVLEFWTQKDRVNSKKKKVNFAANEDLLKQDETFEFIQRLGEFWCNPYDYLSLKAQKYFAVLNIYQNKLWQMVVSVCFYKFDKDKNNDIFDSVLPQVVAYNALGLMYGKGGSSGVFWGFMKANANIIENKTECIFETGINLPNLKVPPLENFLDFSSRALAKQVRYILAVYALLYSDKQETQWNKNGKNYTLAKSEIEHIFPKKWQDTNYNGWNEEYAKVFLEHIGNKMLLEKKENIEAGNGYFHKKKERYKNSYYVEAQDLANSTQKDWLKEDIQKRDEQIYQRFAEFFKAVFGEK
ncbi:DUF262 domain-containing protein [Helicobacter turcicus]|uniref:DUF262 domain-containing HNH endonuclease family protein n=1 Tax=Helicobacter turcicus TaxID=2867412 RepID=A0ABS7JKS5_9HELI|nr:DUF262 domain-containing protein [Helicobacter turcicus]MBX7489995.1 DUF262 domain-containing HNH endonuclease family protein [Helicobacter turcicus]MBX7544854.1 DUF262 domain-containing HNH endonuclease family protein [Helicobacter turcicus]